jgi:tetratricopeptide (TPR) repeat protein
MRAISFLRAWPAALVILAITVPAGATESAARETARELFREGATLVRGGDFDGAVAAFEQSLALYPHASTFYNLGLAEQQRGRLDAAASYLRRALERVVANPSELTPESRRSAEERLASIERELGPARVDAPAALPPTASVAPIPFAPPPAASTVAAMPHGAPPIPAAASTVRTRSPLLVPALGVAAAGAISTVIFGSLALAKQAELDRTCSDPSRCPSGTADEADELATLAIIADVSLALAVVGTGVSVYAWLSPGPSPTATARIGFSGSF